MATALGGVIFEWVDEWWKAYEPSLHDSHTQWPGPVKGGLVLRRMAGAHLTGGRKVRAPICGSCAKLTLRIRGCGIPLLLTKHGICGIIS